MTKLSTLKKLYNFFVEETESFEEDNIGSDLAYLMGAILNNDRAQWSPDRPIVQLLRAHKKNAVAKYALKHVLVRSLDD